jgi:LuxR family maltose regulon positive regulatory protein
MAESSISSRDQAATDPRDDLLATKLTVPRIRSDRLTRSRLLEQLNHGMARELILVCTPAGFGKTTLLADWATSARCPVAWLSLDPQDNDPARFWRYMVAALARVRGGLAERILPLPNAPARLASRGVVTALINELEAVPDEVALVFDDYHVIDSGSIHDGLAFLLSYLPRQLHVVIASRSDPPLPLARLRASGQLAELRAADLRFTAVEAAAFLQEVSGVELSSEAAATLEARMEGWAVGLQLAALSLRERPDPEAFLDNFGGTHRYVLDYLSEEVLGRQPEQLVRFLLETSILERLSGPLCDAVTGGSDGQDRLEELERANLFLVSLDEQRRWWRLHHLFGDLLQVRLQRGQASRVPDLHSRAGTWCEQHGLTDEAIRHASASGDSAWATRLVEQHLAETLRRGESAMLGRWLSLLPDDAVRSRPALCLAQAVMDFDFGHLDAVERLLEHAERAFDQSQEPQMLVLPTNAGMVAKVPAAIALLRAGVATGRGEPERAARYARSALTELTEDEPGPRFWARWLQQFAAWMSGRMEDAEAGFAEVLAGGTGPPADLHASTFLTLGRVQQVRGKLSAALQTCQEGLRFATAGGRFLPAYAGEAHVGIAQVLYERNELGDALDHVTKGIELTRQVVEFQLPALGLVTLSRIRQAMGQVDAALQVIEEACRIHPATDIVSLLSPAAAERARLLLALGRQGEATAWTEERGLTEQDEVTCPRERDYLVLARVLLASHEPARALRLLERLDALADAQGRTGDLLETRALRCLALEASGDHHAALTALAEALALARPEGYIRAFADEGPPMAALLRSLGSARRRGRLAAGSSAAAEQLHRVVRAFGSVREPADTAGVPTSTGLVEPLTDRELEVLRLLAAGRRNRDIAQELMVTLETVKKHTSHIFDKLGAASRTEAVAHARRLGLLS